MTKLSERGCEPGAAVKRVIRAWLAAVLMASVTLLAMKVAAQSVGEYTENGAAGCVPDCRIGFACVDGECMSPCNPSCVAGEVCTRGGHCIPSTPPATPRPAYNTSAAARQQYPHSQQSEPAEDVPNFLLLINPADIAFSKLVFDFWSICMEIVAAGRYAGLSLQPMIFVYEDLPTVGGLLGGLRILPMGKGVRGFHLQIQIGGLSAPAFMSGLGLGYTWVKAPLAFSIGGYVLYLYIATDEGHHAFIGGPSIALGFGG